MLPPLLEPHSDRLLAKSYEGAWKGSYSLVGHTADVVNAVTTLVEILGQRLLDQFSLRCNLDTLKSTARLAAYLHDWGKANDHFQEMVRGKRNPRDQMLRHEALSILLALEYRTWLEQDRDLFFTAVAAAGAHHLKLGGKAGKPTPDFFEDRASGDDRIYFYLRPAYFKDFLVYGVKTLGLPRQLPENLKNPPECWDIAEIKARRIKAENTFVDEWQPDHTLVAVVKSLLIAGDAIASASPQVNWGGDQDVHEWMRQELNQTLSEADLQNVIDARRDGKPLYPFQEALYEESARVTMARAGCGTGKTLGAYNWARKHAIDRKLFFCYPTTGTSTEGFLDYTHDKVESILLHSRAEVDLELAQTGEEEDNGGEMILDDDGKLIQSFEDEAAKKLDSFKAWGPKVSVCTIDTVLGLLQCNRRPLYCFPAIANAAFVFDEVHCYDDALFGALLRFLKVVKAPILLMSASFLPWQVDAIRAAVGEDETVPIIPGDPKLEELPRYHFHELDQPDWDRVQQEIDNGGKVLWVCNQVNTAIAIYEYATQTLSLPALLYHSRYRYEDRVKHHRAVISAFKPGASQTFWFKGFSVIQSPGSFDLWTISFIAHLVIGLPILAVTTQVAEMSLDLSATLLVTQIADPAGLIQRLGRLNRKYCGFALDAIFYPEDPKMVGYPYSKDDLNDGKALVGSFQGGVNQAQLAAWLEGLNVKGKPKDHFVWLDGKWRTYPAPLRESGHNVTALLGADLSELKRAICLFSTEEARILKKFAQVNFVNSSDSLKQLVNTLIDSELLKFDAGRCKALKQDIRLHLIGTSTDVRQMVADFLEKNLEGSKYKIRAMTRKLLMAHTVPLLTKNTKNWKERYRGYLVAPTQQWVYSTELGAKEIKGR